jgi:hypothetical protein
MATVDCPGGRRARARRTRFSTRLTARHLPRSHARRPVRAGRASTTRPSKRDDGRRLTVTSRFPAKKGDVRVFGAQDRRRACARKVMVRPTHCASGWTATTLAREPGQNAGHAVDGVLQVALERDRRGTSPVSVERRSASDRHADDVRRGNGRENRVRSRSTYVRGGRRRRAAAGSRSWIWLLLPRRTRTAPLRDLTTRDVCTARAPSTFGTPRCRAALPAGRVRPCALKSEQDHDEVRGLAPLSPRRRRGRSHTRASPRTTAGVVHGAARPRSTKGPAVRTLYLGAGGHPRAAGATILDDGRHEEARDEGDVRGARHANRSACGPGGGGGAAAGSSKRTRTTGRSSNSDSPTAIRSFHGDLAPFQGNPQLPCPRARVAGTTYRRSEFRSRERPRGDRSSACARQREQVVAHGAQHPGRVSSSPIRAGHRLGTGLCRREDRRAWVNAEQGDAHEKR